MLYLKKNIRSSAALTTSYVEATLLDPQGIGSNADPVENNKLVLLVGFTIGSLTSAEIKIEFSDDGETYYQETNSSVSGGTSTLTVNENKMSASGNYVYSIEYTARYIKVSAKGTGTVTDSLMSIDAIVALRP